MPQLRKYGNSKKDNLEEQGQKWKGERSPCLLGNQQNKVFVMSPMKKIYQTKCSEDLLLFPKIELVTIFQ